MFFGLALRSGNYGGAHICFHTPSSLHERVNPHASASTIERGMRFQEWGSKKTSADGKRVNFWL
jgi:hypothetical protein